MSDGDGVRYARGSGGQRPDAGLARRLGELAREMQAEATMTGLVQRVVMAAVREVEGADHAGITFVEHGGVRVEAATDDLVARLDDAQYRLKQGPCMTSLHDEVTIRSDDFRTEDRWPEFVAVAMGEGVRSMLSVQLFVEGDNLGALNLYADEPDAFDNDSENIAMLLAAHAAVAVKGNRSEAELRVALDSRDLIGQAKGILMERFKIGPVAAFGLLVDASQQTNRKLRDVADDLATTGDFETP